MPWFYAPFGDSWRSSPRLYVRQNGTPLTAPDQPSICLPRSPVGDAQPRALARFLAQSWHAADRANGLLVRRGELSGTTRAMAAVAAAA